MSDGKPNITPVDNRSTLELFLEAMDDLKITVRRNHETMLHVFADHEQHDVRIVARVEELRRQVWIPIVVSGFAALVCLLSVAFIAARIVP